MRLSQDRISHLSHLVLDELLEQGFIFMAEDYEPSVRTRIKKAFAQELKVEEALEEKIRKKISSYKRTIPEGSSEWQILYQRFRREEQGRKGIT